MNIFFANKRLSHRKVIRRSTLVNERKSVLNFHFSFFWKGKSAQISSGKSVWKLLNGSKAVFPFRFFSFLKRATWCHLNFLDISSCRRSFRKPHLLQEITSEYIYYWISFCHFASIRFFMNRIIIMDLPQRWMNVNVCEDGRRRASCNRVLLCSCSTMSH